MLQIELDDLRRYFGEREVLTGLSVSFSGGERVLVRGPNGSGKSTLLKILAGVLAPSGGSLRVLEDGEERDDDWRRLRTGYLAPDLMLYDEFSPLENLEFFGRIRGLPRDAGRDQGLLDRVGLGDRAHDPLGTLSTGLRQRAKLAFALQAEPRILLLDEPGSNLDEPGRALVSSVVDASSSPGGIVIVASNDPQEFSLGTRTVELG